MTHARCKVYLAVLLLSLARPQVLLGLNTATSARQFLYNEPERDAGPDWLVWRGPSEELRAMPSLGLKDRDLFEPNSSMRLGGFMQSDPGHATSAGGWSTCKSAAIFGLEFGGAAAGTVVAVAAASATSHFLVPDQSSEAAPIVSQWLLLATSVATNPCLTAAGTCLVGGLVGQSNSYWHTLVGSLVGGTAGIAGALWYANSWSSQHSYWGKTQSAVSLSLLAVLPLIGAVVAHNVWKTGNPQ